mmetsp:Transcript_98097/g.194218  ORF Transcript_98097/g.194218 Transcript_98097/m.194218 type:complete len:261 (-) Transcript_98097:501-1283(-)
MLPCAAARHALLFLDEAPMSLSAQLQRSPAHQWHSSQPHGLPRGVQLPAFAALGPSSKVPSVARQLVGRRPVLHHGPCPLPGCGAFVLVEPLPATLKSVPKAPSFPCAPPLLLQPLQRFVLSCWPPILQRQIALPQAVFPRRQLRALPQLRVHATAPVQLVPLMSSVHVAARHPAQQLQVVLGDGRVLSLRPQAGLEAATHFHCCCCLLRCLRLPTLHVSAALQPVPMKAVVKPLPTAIAARFVHALPLLRLSVHASTAL